MSLLRLIRLAPLALAPLVGACSDDDFGTERPGADAPVTMAADLGVTAPADLTASDLASGDLARSD
jgi:hypothetical protein